MQLRSICAIDLHHSHCTVEAQTAGGNKVLFHKDVKTDRQSLIEVVKVAPGPKVVIIEEGPMADWAMRVPTDAARGAAHKGGMRGSSMGAATAVSGV